MVCPRCILAVSQILEELNITYKTIKLGEVELVSILNESEKESLSKKLQNSGFSLKIHHSSEDLDVKWADYIGENIHLDYKYLSSLFSSVESITFEQYIINQKIEHIKELLVYDELTLSEIAFKMNYSSVAYLSNQFKKVTGMTPSQFKKAIDKNRKFLDEI